MNGDERRALLAEITERIEKLEEDSYDLEDSEHGKVIWPPEEGMEYKDAMTTLYDIADCSLDISLEEPELTIIFNNTEIYQDSPGTYASVPLKELLAAEIALHVEEKNTDGKRYRLLTRLMKCFDEEIET